MTGSAFSSLWRKLMVGLLFGIVVITAIVIASDVGSLYEAITSLSLICLVKAVFFMLLVYAGRFFKWRFLLCVLNVKIPWLDCLRIFLAGLSMGITPGKAGEVLKSYILKCKYDIDFSLTAPTIIGERLTGVLGAMLLCFMSVICLKQDSEYAYYIVTIVCIVVGVTILFFRCRLFAEWIFALFSRLSVLKKRMDVIRTFYDSAVNVLGIRNVLFCTLISVAYWFMECMIFFSFLQDFDVGIGLGEAVFILTVVSIGGGLTLLPGSIGALEGGLIGMLLYHGVSLPVASSITLLHRFFAMWLVVVLGGVILMRDIKAFCG